MNRKKPPQEKLIIGRKDKVDFPELGLYEIDAKIDTGAYTSSIHCHHIHLYEKGGGEMVQFNLLDPSHPDYNEKLFQLPVYRRKTVRSSSGHAETRIFIRTSVVIFGMPIDLELSLTDRSDMKYPVLLGRKLLKGRFVVDVARVNLSYHHRQRTNETHGRTNP